MKLYIITFLCCLLICEARSQGQTVNVDQWGNGSTISFTDTVMSATKNGNFIQVGPLVTNSTSIYIGCSQNTTNATRTGSVSVKLRNRTTNVNESRTLNVVQSPCMSCPPPSNPNNYACGISAPSPAWSNNITASTGPYSGVVYNWYVGPIGSMGGGTIVSGQGTNSININLYNYPDGATIYVTISSTSGGGSCASSFQVMPL